MKIIVKEIVDEPVKIFYPNGKLICETNNELIFNDIRIQIKDKGYCGCYIEFRGQKYPVDKEGQIDNWPDGLFTTSTKQLNYLYGI